MTKSLEALIAKMLEQTKRFDTVHISEVEAKQLIAALEQSQQRIEHLENDEVRQRLANAEHQLHMAELAKHNLKASRKAQFRKRLAAEKRLAELEARPLCVKLPDTLRAFITDDDIKALDRFVECCEDPDAGGHDLRTEQVQRLVSIGILRKSGRNYHETTDFGDFVLSLGGSVEGSE